MEENSNEDTCEGDLVCDPQPRRHRCSDVFVQDFVGVSLDTSIARGPREVALDAFENKFLSSSLRTPYRWANNSIEMGQPQPGPYSDLCHPWIRGVLNCKDSDIAVQKGAQLGFSAMAIVRALFEQLEKGRDVLYVLPTGKSAENFSSGRFDILLNINPHLKARYDAAACNLARKTSGSSVLYVRGAGGKDALISTPVSVMVLDEVDRMDQRQVAEARERLSGTDEENRTFLAISTPSAPGRGINHLYRESTQDQFTFECPGCSKQIQLRWPDSVEICGESATDPDVEKSRLRCHECDKTLEHEDKPIFMAKGSWQSDVKDAVRRGFKISQLYSHKVKPLEIAKQFLRGQITEWEMQALINDKIGETFVGEGAQITLDQVTQCLNGHRMTDPRPTTSDRLITMGLDPGTWSYWSICEWHNAAYSADVHSDAVCRVLDAGKFHRDEWHIAQQKMKEWKIHYAVVDLFPEQAMARSFCKQFEGFAATCKYQGATKEFSETTDETNVVTITADRTHWLDTALGKFKTRQILLPADIPSEFFAQIQAPVARYRDTANGPRREYTEGGDHFAHTLVYNCIALLYAVSDEVSAPVTRIAPDRRNSL